MTWGCKPENHPDGCRWASSATYPRLGLVEWWCDLCERGGDRALRPLPLHRTEAGYPNCSTCDGGGCLDCTDPA